MTTITEIQTRIAQVLEDSEGTRYSTELLAEAVRLALDTLDQRIPRLLTTEIELSEGGRDLLLPALPDCLYLVSLQHAHGKNGCTVLEPEGGFSYQIEGDQMLLHFYGRRLAKSGDRLTITYAACHRIEGLDAADATTLPAAFESALVNGAAGHACLLHATRLAEAYGARPGEAARLLEISQLRLDEFGRTLGNLKVLQEFGFPPGFRLDEADSMHTGGF